MPLQWLFAHDWQKWHICCYCRLVIRRAYPYDPNSKGHLCRVCGNCNWIEDVSGRWIRASLWYNPLTWLKSEFQVHERDLPRIEDAIKSAIDKSETD
jgi:hypothetical protein